MKKLHTFFIISLFLFVSCSKDEEVVTPTLSSYEKSVISYFKEIALGFEFGNATKITRKWKTPMKIYVGGKPNPILQSELKKITDEINALATDGFSVAVVNDSLQSNFYIFLGSGDDYAKIYPNLATLIKTNFGLFSLFWNNNQINRGNMYVDIVRANATAQKHLLREELTQSLGLGNDSPLYLESIFQSDWTLTTEYAPMDRDLIRLLYHPQIEIGLDANRVEQELEEILLND